jgi:hypothetical protein
LTTTAAATAMKNKTTTPPFACACVRLFSRSLTCSSLLSVRVCVRVCVEGILSVATAAATMVVGYRGTQHKQRQGEVR